MVLQKGVCKTDKNCKKMKIGILTHPLDYNYGCLLQNYALQTTLRRMGHEAITINRFSKQPTFLFLCKYWAIRFLLKFIKHKKVSLMWNPFIDIETKDILASKTKLFVDRNIVSTERVFPSDLKRIDQKYKFDAYVVGSDQVWLPHFSLNAFLDFVERDNVKRVFYAASSGKTSFADDPYLISRCKELSKFFSGISVREASLVSISQKYLGVDATQVLDPTLLLDSMDYINACAETVDDKPVIFTYILDKSNVKMQVVERVRTDLNLPIARGSVEEDYVKGITMEPSKHIYPSVDSWILNLARSKFVVTDSFHGTCLSIVFRKPFVVIGNVERGIERFNSLLKLFNLQKRLITNISEFDSSFYDQLDNGISSKINILKGQSLSFLKNNLQ